MTSSNEHNRILATIVFTDVVGYSARMGTDESATIDLLGRDLAYMTAEAARFGGRVIKTTGDGLLLQFGSAGQAVEFAMTVQTAFNSAAEARPTEECLQHRIGIHLGDVIISDGDVLGDGVNIAARVLAEAEPGGICFSQTVYDVIKNRLGFKATYLGPRELKNIRDAVPLYQILVAAATKQQDAKAVPQPLPAQVAPSQEPELSPGVTRKWIYALGLAVIVVAATLVYFKMHPPARPGPAASALAPSASAPSVPAPSVPAPSAPTVFVTGIVNPVPPDAALAAAESAIKEKFAAGYASSLPKDRQALAQTLFAEAKVTSDTAARFVCYREAQRVAAANENLYLSLAVISATAKDYSIDADNLRASAFSTVAAQVMDTNACVQMARKGLQTLGDMIMVNGVLVNVDNPAAARRLVAAVEILVARAKRPQLANQLKWWSDQVAYAERIHAARETLKDSPDDPIANLTAGEYLAFTRTNWSAALPLLAKGSRPLVRDAATKELTGAADEQSRLAIADAWRKAAKFYAGNWRAQLLAHADTIAVTNSSGSGLPPSETKNADK